MNPRSLFIALGFLAVFLAIFVPLALRVNDGRNRTLDAERLRRTYAALALYETTHDGLPAPNLTLVRQDVEAFELQSVLDPHVADAGPFSLDPFCASLSLRSPTRVSWSYRWHWPEAGKARILDGRAGVLADPWSGLRVAESGALIDAPGGAKTFTELFGN